MPRPPSPGLTCRELAEFLWRYLSDELSAGERFAFDAHLAVCPHCVHYLQGYEKTIELGRQAFAEPDASAPPEVPEELVQAILSARARPAR